MRVLAIFQAFSIIRAICLGITSFFLIQGLLDISVPSLPIWMDISLFIAVLHLFTDNIRINLFKDTRILITKFLAIFWLLFLRLSNLTLFIVDNTYGIQSLISGFTLAVIGIYFYQSISIAFNVFSKIKISSRLLITLSFLLVIIIGTIFLMLPISAQPNMQKLSFIDAFFTAVSAVCVTGLTVVDTSTYFSRFGQTVILILIQIGALGLVTITTTFMALLGRNLSLTGQLSAKDSISNPMGDKSLNQFLGTVLCITIGIEFFIAIILFFRFFTFLPLGDAIFYSVFHAISAFCNAGFALFSNSLMSFRTDVTINIAIMLAIIAGGLGFSVWSDLYTRFIKKETVQLQLQSYIAVRVSLFLIVIGTVLFYIFERKFSLQGLPLADQWLSSLFATVNLRTAGFNTIDLGATQEPSRLMSIVMMYIGASPGSTGGGIKTTSFMVLIAAFQATMRNDDNISIYNRRIDSSLVNQAWALVFNSIAWITCVATLICFIEQLPLSEVLYETVSAYATVGVSIGITPELSYPSKTLLSITMILGRVGPTTIMLALMGRAMKKSLIKTPPTSISIG